LILRLLLCVSISPKKQNFMVVGNTGLGVPHSGSEQSVAGAEFLPPPDWARPVTCSAVISEFSLLVAAMPR
jgi:hypothetical protein